HSIFPAGYHCDPKQPLPFAGMASQKNHMSLYLVAVYGNPAQEKKLRDAWAKAGKKLDMGKACIRFKKLDDLPLEALGEIPPGLPAKAYIAQYESALAARQPKPAAKKPAKAKAPKTAATRAGRPTRAAPKKKAKVSARAKA